MSEAQQDRGAEPRAVSRYELCERHAPWFAGTTRRRTLECMVEGGPGGWSPGCAGGRCRLWPGTDTFDPAVCTEELELKWTKAAPATAQTCEWFATCTNPAEVLVPHPILGSVPSCARCQAVVGNTTESTTA